MEQSDESVAGAWFHTPDTKRALSTNYKQAKKTKTIAFLERKKSKKRSHFTPVVIQYVCVNVCLLLGLGASECKCVTSSLCV